MYVTYAGEMDTPFDRHHWIDVHLPMVRECWRPHGLERAGGFFPDGDDAGLIAICACVFRDDAAMQAALASPETARVMVDVANVTQVAPERSLACPVSAFDGPESRGGD